MQSNGLITVMESERNQKIFAFKKLESENLDQLNQLKDYPQLTEY